MNSIKLLEIPYQENALHYMEQLLSFAQPILFDSGRPESQQGRFDILSAEPLYEISYSNGELSHSIKGKKTLNGNGLLEQLNQWLKQMLIKEALPKQTLPFYGGFAGFLSYDLGRNWEKLPSVAAEDITLPQLQFAYYPWAAVLDHQDKKAWLSFLPDCPKTQQNIIEQLFLSKKPPKKNTKKFNIINELKSNFNVNSYTQCLKKIQAYIAAGDCYQVNFSQRFSSTYSGDPWQAYQLIRKNMIAPFGGYLQHFKGSSADISSIICFSPERFIELKAGKVLTQPIKGTAKRSLDPAKDKQAADSLQDSAKNKAENLMIVDLLRNDLGKCCEFGSVKTEKLFELQSLSNVHHLVSSISAQLSEGKTAFDLLQATFPGGSITGAPKVRAMEIIEELEPERRAIYCGSLFYININGDMDSNIAIRTVLCNQGDIYCWGGGGIVADSIPEEEYQESLDKIFPLIKALNKLKQ